MTATRRPTRLASAAALARAVRSASRPGSAGLGTRLAAVPRLVSAVRRGEYLGASGGQLLTVLASAAYVLSPADLVPEGLLGLFGLGDDAIVLAYAASAFVNLTEDFLAWEAQGGTQGAAQGAGEGEGASHRSGRSTARETVDGYVVR